MSENYRIDSPLYWDIPRIDDYLDQFSSLDLNQTMTGGKIGVGGPTIVTGEISQVPFTRPKRDREKVTEFERYLRRHNRIKQGRPTGLGPYPRPDFWEDTFRARKIEFKSVDPNDTATDNVVLWIADSTSRFSTSSVKPHLYLIQEYRGGNDREYPRFNSGYARLQVLKKVFHRSLGKTRLVKTISRIEQNDPDTLFQLEGYEPEILEQSGGTELSFRSIHAIYELKFVSGDTVNGLTVYGYPIIITAAAEGP